MFFFFLAGHRVNSVYVRVDIYKHPPPQHTHTHGPQKEHANAKKFLEIFISKPALCPDAGTAPHRTGLSQVREYFRRQKHETGELQILCVLFTATIEYYIHIYVIHSSRIREGQQRNTSSFCGQNQIRRVYMAYGIYGRGGGIGRLRGAHDGESTAECSASGS